MIVRMLMRYSISAEACMLSETCASRNVISTSWHRHIADSDNKIQSALSKGGASKKVNRAFDRRGDEEMRVILNCGVCLAKHQRITYIIFRNAAKRVKVLTSARHYKKIGRESSIESKVYYMLSLFLPSEGKRIMSVPK